MSFRDLRRLLVASNNQYVALDPSRDSALKMAGMAVARGDRVDDASVAAAFAGATVTASAEDLKAARDYAAAMAAPMFVPGPKGTKTAVVSFRGVVTYDIEFQPYAISLRNFTSVMQALTADASVSSIVLYVDSPGGTVFGLPEAADAVYAARQAKKVTAVVDILCASAAYYVASQATEITAMPSGAGVGSIGVRMMHVSCAGAWEQAGIQMTHIHSGEFKVEGNSEEPLSDEARARYQYVSDTYYREFVGTVARGRETTVDDVLANYGKGRVLMPLEAKRAGLIDKLEMPADAMKRLGVSVMSAAAKTESVQAQAEQEDQVEPETTAEVVDDQKVNEGLTAESAVDVAAVADLDRRRRLLRLTAS